MITTDQITLIDIGDTNNLLCTISFDGTNIQTFDPIDRTYTPSYSGSKITANVFLKDQPADPTTITNIKWYKNGALLENQNGLELSISDVSTVTKKDVYRFECQQSFDGASSSLSAEYDFTCIVLNYNTVAGIISTPEGTMFTDTTSNQLSIVGTLRAQKRIQDLEGYYIEIGAPASGLIQPTKTLGDGWDSIFKQEFNHVDTDISFAVNRDVIQSSKTYKVVIYSVEKPISEQLITFYDRTDSVQVSIKSSNGLVLKPDTPNTILTGMLFSNNEEIDASGTEYTYKWTVTKLGKTTTILEQSKSITVLQSDLTSSASYNLSVFKGDILIGNAIVGLAVVKDGEKGALDEEQVAEMNSKIDSKADAKSTQEQQNLLEEAIQLQKAELDAKVAMAQFDKIMEEYSRNIQHNAELSQQSERQLIEAFSRLSKLTLQYGELKELKTFISTYISESEEGLIIGANDGSSTFKVSKDRISLFSAGTEVMYITQGLIHIDNGIFTKTLQVGRYRIEQYTLNPDMNVIRYIG